MFKEYLNLKTSKLEAINLDRCEVIIENEGNNFFVQFYSEQRGPYEGNYHELVEELKSKGKGKGKD